DCPHAPHCDKQGGEQHQEAVGYRPADELGDHCAPPLLLSCCTMKSPPFWVKLKATTSPALMPATSAGVTILKVMVIAPQPREGTGPCDTVIPSALTASTLPRA